MVPSRATLSPQVSPIAGPKVRQVWTAEEDKLLAEAVALESPEKGSVSWHRVATHIPGRNNKDCRKRWHYSIANSIRKGTWMKEEDEKLREAVGLYGARWSKIAEAVGTRNGDQCWKRWYDCLDPRIDKSPWTPEEDARLLHLVSQIGRNWSDIVHEHFPNRTSLAAKNRYSILLRRRDGNSSPTAARGSSSSVRHAKSGAGRSSASTPSLSPSPYLGVVNTPSITPLHTPEPEFAAPDMMDGDWFGLDLEEVDVEGFMSQWLSTQQQQPQLSGYVAGTQLVEERPRYLLQQHQQQREAFWAQSQQYAFQAGVAAPPQIRIQTNLEGMGMGCGNGQFYGHGQQIDPTLNQQDLRLAGVRHEGAEGYQGQIPYQQAYESEMGLGIQGQSQHWQRGFNMGGW